MKNEQMDRFIKLMVNGSGKNFSPLNALIQSGNSKVPRTTAIFNMGSATDCPSKTLGFCQAYAQNGTHVCYARKFENSYRPTVLPYRRKQEQYWKTTSAEQFVVDFLILNALKVSPFTALRLNEAGDFWDQACVDKAEHIARVLKKYGIRTYCYTSRQDLDFSKVHCLVISGSGFQKAGIRGVFKMVYSKKDRPAGYGICPMDCKSCQRCLIGRKTAVLKH